jgi:hypothetical protein
MPTILLPRSRAIAPPLSPTEKQTWTLLRVAVRSRLQSLKHNIGECITISILSNSYKIGKDGVSREKVFYIGLNGLNGFFFCHQMKQTKIREIRKI